MGIRAKIKPYIAKSSTPDFFENLKGFLRNVIEGIPQNELQGKTKQLSLEDIQKFSEETVPETREEFSEWLVNKAEDQLAKKYPPGDLKGREKIMDDLEADAEIRYARTVRNVEKTIEETPEEHRDEVLRGGQYQADEMEELDESTEEARRDLEGLIEAMEDIKEPETFRVAVRRERFREAGIPEDIMEEYRVMESEEELEEFKEAIRG